MQRVRISPLVAVDDADAAQPQATSAAVGIAERLRLEAEAKHHRLLAILQGLPTPIKQKHAVGFFSIIDAVAVGEGPVHGLRSYTHLNWLDSTAEAHPLVLVDADRGQGALLAPEPAARERQDAEA